MKDGILTAVRDLSTSAVGFSWAMTLFGARQVGNLLRPRQMAKSLDSLTGAVEGQLGDNLLHFG